MKPRGESGALPVAVNVGDYVHGVIRSLGGFPGKAEHRRRDCKIPQYMSQNTDTDVLRLFLGCVFLYIFGCIFHEKTPFCAVIMTVLS